VRLALVGAFPFPLPQGSQVYFAEQAGALRAAGAEVVLVTYGRGAGAPPVAAAELPVVRVPRALTPHRLASGASPAKPVADAALAAALCRAHRRHRFDAVLAHNAEAALAALAVRRWLRRPVVYVAHTLWAHELPSWTPGLGPLGARLGPLGAFLDARLARHADGVLAVSEAGARALAPHARGPLAAIPPGLAPGPDPDPLTVAEACRRRGLEPGRFALYVGNLDAYQSLDTLAGAAARLAAPVVAVTHGAGRAPAPLRTVAADDAGEARRLLYSAGAALLPRRAPGGFPVKLLNYLEARRPVALRADLAEGLVHRRSAWLVADDAGPREWAAAIGALLADPGAAARLGAAGRRRLEQAHDPAALAARTLSLLEAVAGQGTC